MTTDSDNTPRDLRGLVLDRIRALGDDAAATYFEVSPSTIRVWRTGKNDPTLAAVQRCWDDSLLCQAPEVWGSNASEPVALLLPMYENLEPITFFTLFRAIKHYGIEKVRVIPKWRTLIVEARNDLVERALLTSSQWFIFGDADSVLPCGNASVVKKYGMSIPEHKANRNAIARLMSHPSDKLIVGALYKDRRGGTRAQCEGAFKSAQENARLLGYFDGKTQGDELEQQGWIGFGLVRIHRSVFEKMKEAAKPGGGLEEIAPAVGRETEPYGYFRTTSQQRGEDVVFCRRAGKIGIPVFVDPGCLLGHIGKKTF